MRHKRRHTFLSKIINRLQSENEVNSYHVVKERIYQLALPKVSWNSFRNSASSHPTTGKTVNAWNGLKRQRFDQYDVVIVCLRRVVNALTTYRISRIFVPTNVHEFWWVDTVFQGNIDWRTDHIMYAKWISRVVEVFLSAPIGNGKKTEI